MASELIFRGHESQPVHDSYSPKPLKPWLSVTRPIRYVLREQRLLFVLVGIAIATFFFTFFPSSSRFPSRSDSLSVPYFEHDSVSLFHEPRVDRSLPHRSMPVHSFGKVPLGIKRKGLRIVVTGGAGFVGSHLVDRLIARGDSVIVVDNFFTGRKENVMHHFGNPRFELIRHDVVEPLLLEVDQIYHLACPASPVHYKFNPVKTIKTNVVGTLNMLGLAKRVGARFLLTSTSEVYGDPLQHPQKETYWGNVNPIGVRSCYDEGKRTAETLTMDYHRGAGVEVRIARIFNTYGPRMCLDDGRVVSNFVAQALRKEPLTVYGDGKQTRSFQYVSDLIRKMTLLPILASVVPSGPEDADACDQERNGYEPGGPVIAVTSIARTNKFSPVSPEVARFHLKVEGLMRLMEGEHVGPFNLGNPGEFTMLELAKVVQETIDPDAKIEYRPNTEDDPHKRKPDISRAKELLGWEPKVNLRKGLPLMVSDFRQRIFGDHKEGATST